MCAQHTGVHMHCSLHVQQDIGVLKKQLSFNKIGTFILMLVTCKTKHYMSKFKETNHLYKTPHTIQKQLTETKLHLCKLELTG